MNQGSSKPIYRFSSLLISATACIAFSFSPASAQEGYPSRTVRIIAPTVPGAGVDMVARIIAQGLSERLGRQVIVENKAGAGTVIGTDYVAKSKPDGHTLLAGLSALAIGPVVYKKMPYDALRDLAPVTQAVSMPLMMVVHPSVPARSIKEMIALARTKPNEVLYASSGVGSITHLSMEHFATMGKIRLTHVPYKGASGVIDLVAGHVGLAALNVLQAIPHTRTGKLRALGVTTPRRIAAVPDVPAIAEELPGYESIPWYGLLAPAGTPHEIIARLHKEAAAILRGSPVRERLEADGAEVVASTPEDFAVFIRNETSKWAKVGKAAGIQPE